MSWNYKGQEYKGYFDVVKEINKKETLEDALELTQAYCKAFSVGESNLQYILSMNPYWYMYSKFHTKSATLRKHQQEAEKAK